MPLKADRSRCLPRLLRYQGWRRVIEAELAVRDAVAAQLVGGDHRWHGAQFRAQTWEEALFAAAALREDWTTRPPSTRSHFPGRMHVH